MSLYQSCMCFCHNTTGGGYGINGCSLCVYNHQQWDQFPQYPTGTPDALTTKEDHYKIITILNEIKSILLDIKDGRKKGNKKKRTKSRKTD